MNMITPVHLPRVYQSVFMGQLIFCAKTPVSKAVMGNSFIRGHHYFVVGRRYTESSGRKRMKNVRRDSVDGVLKDKGNVMNVIVN
ncbi:hypothetical protein U0070_027595 [Myodes glareolus]|uniref:Uncharacterized protein n=1 Tax=Myodes glareolus TaxID=447135 RepID=A0AAW0HBN0_MYOGA